MSDIPKQSRRSYVFAAVLLGLALAAILGYELFFRGKRDRVESRPPVVRTVEIAPATEWETKSYPGVAKESQIANLSFRVPGKLIESNIVVGARIEKDGVIARLDPRDYELAVARLEAELRAAESLYAAMKTGARPEDVSSLESQLAAAESAFQTAETNLNRFQSLLADQVASQAQFDLVKTQYDTAKGQKETLANELEKARTGARREDIDAMEAKILGIRAGLNTARNALDDTRLQAPFEGMIVEKFIEDHEVVAPGIPVVSFVNIEQIDVAVSLPEEMIVRLNDIRGYRVEFESYPRHVFPATLKELGRAVQRGRQSYPLQVRIDLKDGDGAPHSIFPGMAAMVLIDLARQTEPPQTLPLAALTGRNGESSVWVVESSEGKHTVRRRPVKLLRLVDNVAEIESDLKSGEKVVSAGAKFLTDGQNVRLEKNEPGTVSPE